MCAGAKGLCDFVTFVLWGSSDERKVFMEVLQTLAVSFIVLMIRVILWVYHAALYVYCTVSMYVSLLMNK